MGVVVEGVKRVMVGGRACEGALRPLHPVWAAPTWGKEGEEGGGVREGKEW